MDSSTQKSGIPRDAQNSRVGTLLQNHAATTCVQRLEKESHSAPVSSAVTHSGQHRQGALRTLRITAQK
jgi:hypothetical protein